ncbi:MAG: hypothetical protein P1Q69_02455 [Candidatus Thorarchaeota archaeon]|nr:hypothetical protein [Candidatus Thorarchaeota archaeon]
METGVITGWKGRVLEGFERADEYKARREMHEKEVAKRERSAMDLNE